MGKSTLAAMLVDMGIPVHDSDACVHELLAPNARGAAAVAEAFPVDRYPTIYEQESGNIIRVELGKLVFHDAGKKELLESILHPLVREAQQEFLKVQREAKKDLAVLDIPLLFETGAESRVDYIIVVSAPAEVQRARVLSRPGMDEEKFHAILALQMPDALDETRRELAAVLEEIRTKHE